MRTQARVCRQTVTALSYQSSFPYRVASRRSLVSSAWLFRAQLSSTPQGSGAQRHQRLLLLLVREREKRSSRAVVDQLQVVNDRSAQNAQLLKKGSKDGCSQRFRARTVSLTAPNSGLTPGVWTLEWTQLRISPLPHS
jgi:hypothetical protein